MGKIPIQKGETDMGDRGKKDKGERLHGLPVARTNARRDTYALRRPAVALTLIVANVYPNFTENYWDRSAYLASLKLVKKWSFIQDHRRKF